MYIKNLLKKRLFMSMFTFAMIGIIVISSSHALFTETKSNEVDQALTVGNLNVSFVGGQYINNSAIEPMTDAVALTKEDNKYTFTITNSGSVASNYTISLIDNPEYLSGGSNYNSNGTILNHNFIRYSLNGSTPASLGEQDNNKIKIGTLNPGKTKSFILRIWVADAETYSLPNEALGSEIHLSIIVDNKASDSIYAKAGRATTSIIAISSKADDIKIINEPATLQTTATTEYRYYGKNPDNYVWFNDELWRIIGVFEVETPEYSGNTITSYSKYTELKIIRNEPIGNYSWDTSASTINDGDGINDWNASDIRKLLNPKFDTNTDLDSSNNSITVNNSLYWNKQSGTCYTGKSNATSSCDFSTNGISENAKKYISETKNYTAGYSDYENTTSLQAYNAERGQNVVIPGTSCAGNYCNDTLVRKTNSVDYVTLMNPSDYGYAVDEDLCNKAMYYYSDSVCKENNWLYNASYAQFTINAYTSYAHHTWFANTIGSMYLTYVYNNFYIRPVVYLQSFTDIHSGKGTQNEPYILSIKL